MAPTIQRVFAFPISGLTDIYLYRSRQTIDLCGLVNRSRLPTSRGNQIRREGLPTTSATTTKPEASRNYSLVPLGGFIHSPKFRFWLNLLLKCLGRLLALDSELLERDLRAFVASIIRRLLSGLISRLCFAPSLSGLSLPAANLVVVDFDLLRSESSSLVRESLMSL